VRRPRSPFSSSLSLSPPRSAPRQGARLPWTRAELAAAAVLHASGQESPQLRLPGHAAASRHRRSRPRVRRTSVAPPPPLQATASLLLSSAATAVPPPRATANPAMSAMASTSSPSIPCAFSPKPKATGVPRPSEPPPVSRCSAWPRLLGPPQDEPWPPTGARRPPLASPHLPRRRRGLLRPEQRAPTTSLFKFTTGTSYKNSTNIRGLTAEPMTHMNSVVKDLVAGNLLIFENA
jgi:hypothetical protein